ncbi:hypothetical protein FAGKG844_10252 [Frankia sp. AgKG'84/4]
MISTPTIPTTAEPRRSSTQRTTPESVLHLHQSAGRASKKQAIPAPLHTHWIAPINVDPTPLRECDRA